MRQTKLCGRQKPRDEPDDVWIKIPYATGCMARPFNFLLYIHDW